MSPAPDLSRPFDIAVVGAGPAGLAFAAAMKQALGRQLRLVVIDPRPEARDGKLRAVALAEGSKNLIERIGAWGALERKAQAIHEMAIFDGRTRDAVRIEQLRFQERLEIPLAHMAFNDDLTDALTQACVTLGAEFYALPSAGSSRASPRRRSR